MALSTPASSSARPFTNELWKSDPCRWIGRAVSSASSIDSAAIARVSLLHRIDTIELRLALLELNWS